MSDEIITDELEQRIIHVLEKEVSSPKRAVTSEIQDDGQCIMIYIPVDDIPQNERQTNFERVGRILNQLVPGRDGDYSWFATFTICGDRVESCFGGNLKFPNTVF